MKQVKIYCDGGSRGNPGEAAIGVFITDENQNVLKKIAERIGFATNNDAEYSALVKGLDWVLENQKKFETGTEILFYLDSQLVYSQVIGIFKVKNDRIRNYIFKIREKEAEIKFKILYHHILREKNKEADKLVNLALDNLL